MDTLNSNRSSRSYLAKTGLSKAQARMLLTKKLDSSRRGEIDTGRSTPDIACGSEFGTETKRVGFSGGGWMTGSAPDLRNAPVLPRASTQLKI
jgi:hypothetical protein